MQDWIRDGPVPSSTVPVDRSWIRTLEVLLSSLVIVVLLWALFGPTGGLEVLVNAGLLFVFVVPPLLAVVALVGAVDDGLGVGAVVVALLALATMYVAAGSVYVLVNPPEGGGVYAGHLFTFAAGVVLAVVVLVRTGAVFAMAQVGDLPT